MPSEKGASSSATGDARRLYAEFELVPSSRCDCPLAAVDSSVSTVRHYIDSEECHADVSLDDDCVGGSNGNTDVVHVTADRDADCFCQVFGMFDCIPTVTGASDRGVRLDVFLPDRAVLSDLMSELKSVTEQVELRRLTPVEDDRHASDAVSAEDVEMTPKQREAAELAVSAGYYSTQSNASLELLADHLGISKSAFCQRLSAVESKLMNEAFNED